MMIATESPPSWEHRRTDETRELEHILGKHFTKVDAYRFNSASIRVRIIDERFEGKSIEEREDLVIPHLNEVPKDTRDDILLLLTIAPRELDSPHRQMIVNLEFDEPLPSKF